MQDRISWTASIYWSHEFAVRAPMLFHVVYENGKRRGHWHLFCKFACCETPVTDAHGGNGQKPPPK